MDLLCCGGGVGGGCRAPGICFSTLFFCLRFKSQALGFKVQEINVDSLWCGASVGGECRAGGMPCFVVGF